jgi:hypothetical protein
MVSSILVMNDMLKFQKLTLDIASRLVIFKAWGGHENLSAVDKVKASTMAGGFSGMMGGLLRE